MKREIRSVFTLKPITNVLRTLLLVAAMPALAWADYTDFFSNSAIVIDVGDGTTGAYTGLAVDVTGDGKNDVVLGALDGTSAGYVYVYRQQGSTIAATPDRYATGGNTPTSLAVGDLNNDGKNDIAVSNYQSFNIAVFTQNSTGTYSAPALIPTSMPSNGAYSIKIADLNNDGLNDIASVENSAFNRSTVTVLLQNSTSGFTLQSYPLPGTNVIANHIAVGDINGDSLNDIVVSLYQIGTATGVVAAFVQSSGTMSGPIYYQPAVSDSMIAGVTGRFNSGSVNDFVVMDGFGARLYSFLDQSSTPTATVITHNASMATGDIDGDGNRDIVTASAAGLDVYLQANLATTTFHNKVTMSHPFPSFVAGISAADNISIGDLTNDNKPDILLVGTRGGTARFAVIPGSTTVSISTGSSGAGTGTSGPEVPQGMIKTVDNVFDPAQGQSVTVQFSLNNGGPTTVKIYTQQGKLIRTIYSDLVDGGSTYNVQWDGRNDAGEMVASGIYLARIEGPRFSKNQKIAVVR